ncbi:hypothetical protein DFH09DRAFT_1277597 [Mycena vulgaris]|nr:hypothetical protein DFH09DRAFT_1277597 [Mycena vulgaris]
MALAWLCLALAQHFPSQGQSQQQARPGQSQWLKPGLERKIFAQQFLRFWGPDELYYASVYYLNNLGTEIVGFTGHKSNIDSINSLGGARSGHGLTGLAWLGKSQARSQGQACELVQGQTRPFKVNQARNLASPQTMSQLSQGRQKVAGSTLSRGANWA